MTRRSRAARAAWFGYWNLMRRYHRYEVSGLEHLDAPGPALIVGYHGRPIAMDLCMLQALLLERTGQLPRAIIHTAFRTTPVLNWIYEGAEFLDGDGPQMAEAVARGERVVVTPGGTREGLRSSRDRYRVHWGGRLGYLRVALKYRLPIVPVASSGVDDTYLALNDGHALGKRTGLPLWIGIGPVGPWPISPPFPVKIATRIGAPIDPFVGGIGPDPADRESLLALHGRVIGAVQALLDQRHHFGIQPAAGGGGE